MAEPSPLNHSHEEEQALLLDFTRRSLELYDNSLKATLEPLQNGRVVAIDAQSGDYAVAKTAAAARRLLRERHPHALIVTRTIGPETRDDLARRLSVSQKVRA